MRTKRWVQLLCFSLLFLLSAQPLCMAATGPTNAEVQEFKEAAYAFAEAASNVPPEIVLAAMPGAIATTEAVGAISKEDAQYLRKVFSDEDVDPTAATSRMDAVMYIQNQKILSPLLSAMRWNTVSSLPETSSATVTNSIVRVPVSFTVASDITKATQIMEEATAKRRILLNGYSATGPVALSSESTEIIIPQ